MLFKTLNDHLKTQGFQQQLSFSFLIAFVSITIAITLCATFYGKQLVSENFHQQSALMTGFFAQQSSLALAYGSQENASDAAKSILNDPNIKQVAIFDQQHVLFFQSGSKQGWHLDDSLHSDIEPIKGPELEFEDNHYWQFIAPVSIGEKNTDFSPYGTEPSQPQHLGYVRVLISKSALQAMFQKMVTGITMIALLMLFFMLILQRRIINYMTKPLYKLIDSMHAVRQQSDWQPLIASGAPEWKHIVKAYNEMMQSVREHEQLIEQKRDEAVEASRLKSEFAANISHELRTPMNGILGMMELLSTMPLDTRQKDYVELAKSSGEQLHLLINDILDFSKLDAGYMDVDEIDFNLPKMVEELVTMHAHSQQSKHLQLSSVYDPNIPLLVSADMTRLRQLLNNLIGNAVKFTAQGSVKVELKLLEKISENTLNIHLMVSDTGIGIAEKDHKRIFAPYSQQDGATNRKFGGTGLGLAISQRIVELLKGQIKVESEPGQGSRFIVEFPCKIVSPQPILKLPPEVNNETTQLITLNLSSVIQQELHCRLKTFGLTFKNIPEQHQLEPLLHTNKRVKNILFIDQIYGLNIAILQVLKSQYNLCIIQFLAAQSGPETTLLADSDLILETPIRSENLLQLLQLAVVSPVISQAPPPISSPPIETIINDEQPISYSDKNVLIVEDNIVNQKVAIGMLKKLGIDADIAHDGAQAIDAVSNKNYDLVFMDCQMPVIDGYHATIEIRRRELQRSLPIVALTANTSGHDIEKCKACGMDDYLSKPVRLQQLQDVLQRWLPVPADI